MIFVSVNNIKKEERPFFEEKIKIYNRLIYLFSQSKGYASPHDERISAKTIAELINIGVIDSENECKILKKTLGEDTFNQFIKSVNFYLDKPEETEQIIYRLRNKSRKECQKKDLKEDKLNVADFFCGAGGLSLGFHKAGYRIVFANDFQRICTETYKYNHPEIPAERIYTGDIKDIAKNINKIVQENIDLVIGGPPCQSFSSANQRRVIDDPRNILYKYFIEAVKMLCPKVVVMENVKGMLKVADQVVEDYNSIKIERQGVSYSYLVSYKLLNAVNFEVAQSRERLIYIAIRNDVAVAENITPETIFKEIDDSCKNTPKYNLESALEFIQPLDAPRIKGQTETDDEKTGMKIGLNKYDSCGNQYLKNINDGRQMLFVFNHKARYCSDVNYEIFRRLDQGEDSTNPKIADIMPYARRNGIFKDKYYKLIAAKPCRTITAHLKMDCLSHIHPYQIRSITPREAARVQSFPDDYLFLGAYLKTYMEIGNAVPVLMAKKIATIIKSHLL